MLTNLVVNGPVELPMLIERYKFTLNALLLESKKLRQISDERGVRNDVRG